MYQQLTSPTTIRVLHIYPATETDPLTCSLEHCDLDNDPNYEAVSYVWGDSDLSCLITCDSKVVPVTRSLHQALRRVRSPTQLRTIWIDGLCINQTDDVEKSHQVQLMQRVFRNAHRVLVWLGPDLDGFARDAFDTCAKLGQREMNIDDVETALATDLDTNHGFRKWFRPIFELAARPWWGRVWIIQEFALAKDLLFLWGAEEIPWTHINLAITNLQKSDVMGSPPFSPWAFEPISRLSAIKDQRCYATSFMGTIHTARKFQCSDSRDRIFAILGLGCGDDRWAVADPDGRSLATATIPDYTLPVEHVYQQFAIMALQRNLTEDIFLAIQHGVELDRWQPGDIPSWSPCWDIPLFNDFPFCHALEEICKFAAFAADNPISFTGYVVQRPSALQSDFDPLAVDTLNILSTTLDEVVTLSDIMFHLPFSFQGIRGRILSSFWEDYIRPAEGTSKYRALMADFLAAATYQIVSEDRVDTLHPFSQDLDEIWSESTAQYETHYGHPMLDSLAQLQSGMSRISPVRELCTFDGGVEHYTDFKRMFITRKGYVGTCPAAAQSGDHVALLWNTSCPMILRPQDDFFRIVGGSYIAALSRKKIEDVPHPLDDLFSGRLRPEMIQIR
jgi:hypothetical protein